MKRSSVVIIVLALLVVGAAAWFIFWPQRSLPEDGLAAVPADSYGVMRVRVDRVLASDAYKRLVVERGEARGVERVTKTCGFNPLARIRDLVVFARPAPRGGMPRFAFTARGELRHEELVDCVRKVTGADSSKLKRDDIEGLPCVMSSQGGSRACFVGRDGLVAGDAESVHAAVNSMLGKAPNVATDAVLSGLFREVDAPSTDVALVARMPDELRPLLRVFAEGMLGAQLAALADVRAVSGNARFDDGKIAGGSVLVTSDAARASEVVALAKSYVDRFLGIPGISMTPAGAVLRGIQMEARGDRATFTGSIKVSTVEALLELLPALDQLRDALAPKPDDAAASAAQGVPANDATQPAPAPEAAQAAQAPKADEPTKAVEKPARSKRAK